VIREGGAENAGVEKAGVEKSGADCKAGKCRSGKVGSKSQGWKMREWKNREQKAGVENAGVEKSGGITDGNWKAVIKEKRIGLRVYMPTSHQSSIATNDLSRADFCDNYGKDTKAVRE